ncbi:MAG: DUF481 domain-containing protein [Chitinophagaceae bacterium]
MARITVLYALLIIALLHGVTVQAQFNDSTHYLVSANLSGNVNRTSSGTNYLLDNSLKLGVEKQQLTLNSNTRWLYGANAGTLINNDFSSIFDCNVYARPKARFNYWALANFTSSYSLKIDYQFQGGSGIAWKAIDKPYLMMRLSDGFLYENSQVLLKDGTTEQYQTLRNSFRIQLRANWNTRISFESVAFWQPSVIDGGDYIMNAQAGISVKAGKWLSFTSRLSYMDVSRTQRQNLLFTYGVTVGRYF